MLDISARSLAKQSQGISLALILPSCLSLSHAASALAFSFYRNCLAAPLHSSDDVGRCHLGGWRSARQRAKAAQRVAAACIVLLGMAQGGHALCHFPLPVDVEVER